MKNRLNWNRPDPEPKSWALLLAETIGGLALLAFLFTLMLGGGALVVGAIDLIVSGVFPVSGQPSTCERLADEGFSYAQQEVCE